MDEKYIKLEEHSDWGTIYYARPGEGLRGRFQTASRKLGLACPEGRVKVLWPDGTKTRQKIRVVAETEDISEHGHLEPQRVHTTRWYLETKVKGVKFQVPVTDVEIEEACFLGPLGVPRKIKYKTCGVIRSQKRMK